MKKEKTADICCSPACCQVESIITVDKRGQMVLPKDAREKAGIHPGDKLALVTMEKEGKTCCFLLMKTDELAGMIKSTLGPLAKEIFV